jgi:hypothetical protein
VGELTREQASQERIMAMILTTKTDERAA